MTIVVSVRVNDGIVLASDSTTSFVNTATGSVYKVYNHANKIFNLIKGKHIGAMTFGSGNIGPASISTLSKDFRHILTFEPNHRHGVDLNTYTIKEVAEKAANFFFENFTREYPNGLSNFSMGYRVVGYSAGGQLPEAWEVGIAGDQIISPRPLYDHDNPTDFGPRWSGETEALDRLLLGVGSRFPELLRAQGLDQAAAENVHFEVIRGLRVALHEAAMPIQDAVDLAKFLAETAAGFAHFSLRAATVGGTIELASITKHEGFKWISRKHYYAPSLNPEGRPT